MNRNAFLYHLLGATFAWGVGSRIYASSGGITVDANYPGGNVLVKRIEEGKVILRPDLRDTEGWWFYWDFRVKGAQGKQIRFKFEDKPPIAKLGPAVSRDGGKTWNWLKQPTDGQSFTYEFAAEESEVRFALGMTYTQEQWELFQAKLKEQYRSQLKEFFKEEQLCKSRKGESVPYYRIGRISEEPQFRVLITARSHACEMMASYALEGLIEEILKDGSESAWLRQNVEFLVVPFVDWDGVKAGDQGKNRKPRDHNRDYDEESVFPETKALQSLIPRLSQNRLKVSLDMHCPWIRGGLNEIVYLVGNADARNHPEEEKFSQLLEKLHSGPIPYLASNNLPYGKGWNVAQSFTAGRKNSDWARTLTGIKLATTIEIPYAIASGAEVTADSARALGASLAKTIAAYLKSS